MAEAKTNQLTEAPHSVEAERGLLGGLMLTGSRNQLDDALDLVSETDFYYPQHQHIFAAIARLALASQPTDPVSVHEKLKDVGRAEECGELDYLGELTAGVVSSDSVLGHAHIVRHRSLLRQMYDAGSWIASTALNPGERESEQLLDEAEQRLFRIGEGKVATGPQLASMFGEAVIKQIDQFVKKGSGITGLSTGFANLDAMTTGLHKGDLVIVAGRPGMGKTSFAMNLVESTVLQQDLAALVFSMEMSSEQLVMRLFSSLGKINQQHLRTGRITDEDWGGINQVLGKLDQMNLYIDDSQTLTPGEIRARARRLARSLPGGVKLGVIMIDYIQLMHLTIGKTSDNRVAEISEITRQIKALAKELEAPVIALSQLNRSLESRQDKRPMMSDLRESGSIEQDADLIMFIYRDDYHNRDSEIPGQAEIIIAKQRNGPTGEVPLMFENTYSRFKEGPPGTGLPAPAPQFTGRIGDFA